MAGATPGRSDENSATAFDAWWVEEVIDGGRRISSGLISDHAQLEEGAKIDVEDSLSGSRRCRGACRRSAFPCASAGASVGRISPCREARQRCRPRSGRNCHSIHGKGAEGGLRFAARAGERGDPSLCKWLRSWLQGRCRAREVPPGSLDSGAMLSRMVDSLKELGVVGRSQYRSG